MTVLRVLQALTGMRHRAPAMITVLMAVSLGGCGASLNVDTQGSGLTSAERPAATDTAAAPTTPATDAKVVTGSTVKTAAATTPPAKAGEAPGPQPASAAKAAEALTAVATPGNEGYKIGPQDVVEVSVFKVPELSKSVQVADTGTINLPLLGEVPAAGRTAQEVERDLAAKLGAKYLQKPQVTVFVKEYNSQRVTIEGAVKKPGVYPVRGRMTLLQLVATAEGFGDTAEQTVVVFRQQQRQALGRQVRRGGDPQRRDPGSGRFCPATSSSRQLRR